MEFFIDFIAGASFGFTSVAVGQPLETVKTRLQASSNQSMVTVSKELFAKEGAKGFYRGGLPIFVGGTLFRSAQFGVHANVLKQIHSRYGKAERLAGVLDVQNMVAGFFGGIGRGLIEGPFDFIKVRRQVAQSWKFSEIYKGTGITVFRNSFLFCFFVTYIDLSKQIVPGGFGAFLTGAICANLAWLTIWPLDVVKSQRQSGLYPGQSAFQLLGTVIREGKLFRGVIPGLSRSFLANGCSMYAYTHVKGELQERFLPQSTK